MYRNSKNKCPCAALAGLHIGAFLIIGATLFALCLMCKDKLAKIIAKIKNCFCTCKDECECAYEDIKDEVSDGSEKENDSEN